jgi:patatin-like phospholipase/acyl hydrolase
MQIDTLALVGCGVKVYALVGSIIELEKTVDLTRINRYIGTSSGSIIALLLNLGLNGQELLSYTNENNAKKVNEHFLGITNYFRQLYNLKKYFGLNRSTVIENAIKEALLKRGYTIDCTFKDLYEKTNKTLTVTASSISDRDTYYFNHVTMPEMKIVDAISMSTSYPIFFTSKHYTINGKQHLFADGGIIDNFPILYYPLCDTSSEMFLNNVTKVSRQTREILVDTRLTKILGIYILDNNYSKNISNLYNGFDTITSIGTFMNSLVKSMSDKIDNLILINYHQSDLKEDVWKYIIPIQLQFEVNSINFNVSNELKNLLLDNGIKYTKEYMENYINTEKHIILELKEI